MKKCRLLSLFLCLFVILVNVHAVTVKAAPLDKVNAYKLASAILNNQKSNSKSVNLYTDAAVIHSFEITDLEAPKNGKLLDTKATVVADTGLKWEIPVLWVDQDGNRIQIAIEIENIRYCYPIFAFYIPDGYRFVYDDSSFNIGMPDFVCRLMEKTGLATIINPATHITYITALLPGQNKILVNNPAPVYDSESYSEEKIGNGTTPHRSDDDHDSDLQYKDYKVDLTTEEKEELVAIHSDKKAVEKLGVENLAWLVSFVKNVLEPEAVNLLESSFPAYKAASENNGLGKNIGLYVYFDTYTDPYGNEKQFDTLGFVYGVPYEEKYEYYLAINAAKVFEYDEKTDNYVFAGDEAYSILDCTLVHEMMHAFMDDYNRAGMSGWQYDTENDKAVEDTEKAVKYPTWFIEGIASATDNSYQFRYDEFHAEYGYSKESNKYIAEDLKKAFVENEDLRLTFSNSATYSTDIVDSAYISGYLANIYLGYLAAQKYDSKDAVTEDESGNTRINSKVILSGVNHILEELHNGKTLDEVISEISTQGDTTLYSSSDDFANKFIASADGSEGDGEKSLDFCVKLLNYMESNSTGSEIVNGSILLDFTDTSINFLSEEYLKEKATDYVISDTKDMVESTVDMEEAYKGGGKSEEGIIDSSESSSEASSEDGSSDASSGESSSEGGSSDASSKDDTTDDDSSDDSTGDEEPSDIAAKLSSADIENGADENIESSSTENSNNIETVEVDAAIADNTETEEVDVAIADNTETEEVDDAIADNTASGTAETSAAEDEGTTDIIASDNDLDSFVMHDIIYTNAEADSQDDSSEQGSSEEQVLDVILPDNSDEEKTPAEEDSNE